jgi:flagellar motor switch protein FliN/FliY
MSSNDAAEIPNGEGPPPGPEGTEGSSQSADGLAFVMDVPVEVTVEIGRRRMRIAEILRLGPGSVLELTKAADEPLDIYVNDKPIARGEAVVVGDHYGIRVTEVLTAEQVRERSRGGA